MVLKLQPFELLKASPAYDLWALAVTLFELFAGKFLFLADNMENIDGEIEGLYVWTIKT